MSDVVLPPPTSPAKNAAAEAGSAFGHSRPTSRASPRPGSRPQSRGNGNGVLVDAWSRPISRGRSSVGSGEKVGPDGVKVAQYSWALSTMHYLPNAARKEAEDAIAASQTEAANLRKEAEQLAKQRDDADRRAADAEVEAQRAVRQANWAADQSFQEQEERISALEKLLAEERRSHQAEFQRLQQMAQTARTEGERRAQDAEARAAQSVTAAVARAEVAERSAEARTSSALQELEQIRQKEAERVEQTRKDASSKVKKALLDQDLAINKARDELTTRSRQMQEDLFINRQRKEESVRDAERFVKEMEAQAHVWKAQKEGEFDNKQANLDAVGMAQQRHQVDFEQHHRGLLALEQMQHGKTVERTMNRVVRTLRLGNHDFNDRSTPTFEVMHGLLDAPCVNCGVGKKHLEGSRDRDLIQTPR